MSNDPWAFCRKILGKVSRTFALTIPVLPAPLADTVCCAYLLCRIADTIEDEHDLGDETRERLFDLLERLVDHPDDDIALSAFVTAWPAETDDAYSRLMAGASDVLEAFRSLPDEHKEPVRQCAREMIAGMRAMTRHGDRGDAAEVEYISSNLQELERYCHYVAGTVGQMLTRLFGSRVSSFATPERIEQGRRFGLGLQLTNILKDRAADRKAGVSFVPEGWHKQRGAEVEFDPIHKRSLVERTLSHLDMAHQYTLALPTKEPGIRLFCVWGLWMAVATLREICVSGDAPKISKDVVQEIISYSSACVTDDAALEARYQEYREQTAKAAAALTQN